MARILIIDDEDELRSMLRQMLDQAGHEVTEAANGADTRARRDAGPRGRL